MFFCAGQAPWHDDVQLLQRLRARLRGPQALLFDSSDIWALAALVLGSRGFCGSSLHGRILAMAGGLPRLNLQPGDLPPQAIAKTQAYADTWELPGLPGAVPPAQLAAAIGRALAADPAALRRHAHALAARCRAGVAALRQRMVAPAQD